MRPMSILAAAALALFGTALSADALDMPVWRADHYRNNPLVGRIVTGAGITVAPADFDAAATGARFVILGEIHTNPDHHVLQAEILKALAARKPALVFEMIPDDLRTRLEAYLAKPGADAAGLGAAVEWSERGWPDWAIYRPIAEVALDAGLAILPGDLPRTTIRRIGREGAASLPADEKERLGLSRPMPEGMETELSATLKESHCGMLPDAAIGPMIAVQRARDGALADAMIEGAGEAGAAVLIAGAGHGRTDWAVPALIAAREPGAATVSVAFFEVLEADEDPADYGLTAEKPGPYDYVVFTPREDISDPCEGLADEMKAMTPAK